MKFTRTIFNFVLLLTSLLTNAQNNDTLFVRYDLHKGDSIEYTVDTLFRKSSFGPHYLFETDWITNTPNQLQAIGYGLSPLDVESNCESEGIESGKNKLESIERNDTALIVTYRVASNCCYAFLGDMNIVDSTTLNLSYIEYGTICGCTCYHNLVFKLKIDYYDEAFQENFKKLHYLTLNNELKTKLE